MNRIKISLIVLGCNKNQIDGEVLMGLLAPHVSFTGNLDEADVIIVSPCTFLSSARREALTYIRTAVQYKQKKCRCVVVTGCYAQLLKQEIFRKIPGVDFVVGCAEQTQIPDLLQRFFRQPQSTSPHTTICCDHPTTVYTRRTIAPSTPTSYIKIADGCDNHCSYCLIPTIRGAYRSRPIKEIVDEARFLAAHGVQEINILAQDIGNYGNDIHLKHGLLELLPKIADVDGIAWIRLLYLHPKHLDKHLVDFIAREKKICKYIDIPLQHVNNRILSLMGRHTTQRDSITALTLLRARIPDVTIRSTFIVGFPSETNEEFEEMCAFLQKHPIDYVGVFPYSREKGTRAYSLGEHIPTHIKQQRVQRLVAVQEQIAHARAARWIGKKVAVLIEGKTEDGLFYGRTSFMAPEVDGRVIVQGSNVQVGKFHVGVIDSVARYEMTINN